MKLSEIGEFNLLQNIVFPKLNGSTGRFSLGDDCGFAPLENSIDNLVVTSDVSPIPLIFYLGYPLYDVYGWYAVTVNVSDLAAGGATPLAFTTSVEAPNEMDVKEFTSFFDGLSKASKYYQIPLAGGNLRSAPRFECHGTAIGYNKYSKKISRDNAKPGDYIVAIGNNGFFLSGIIQLMYGGKELSNLDGKFYNSVTKPIARIKESIKLQENELFDCALDNSDGLLFSLYILAEKSHVDIEIDRDLLHIDPKVIEIAKWKKCDPLNLILSWGDHQLVCSISEKKINSFGKIMRDLGSSYLILGKVIEGDGTVWERNGKNRRKMIKFGNENFSSESYNDVSDIEKLIGGIINVNLCE